ncbi:MAG: ATP-binding protein [Planctomycetota bacterium]
MARIVLIDDEANLRRTLTRILQNEGHEVLEGESFGAVESTVWPGRFDVLISDILMPAVGGLEVLREVVEQRKCREPVVLITGQPNLESAAEAVRHGAFDYVAKPVTKARLLEVVARGLRHVELLRQRDRAMQQEMDLLRNLARLGEQASVLTHEIRTPITSLRHALNAVGDRLGIGDKVVVESLIANIERIERLLGQTLSFARPLDLELEVTSAEQVLRDAVERARALPIVAGMQLEVAVAAEAAGAQVEVDVDLIGEVVINLVRNAAEACGGAGHVRVVMSATADSLRWTVTDDGPGVPADKRDEIFRPFHSSKEYGTGIGLAFSRKVVESHGGSLDLLDHTGGGASFRVALPRVP